MNNTTFNDDQMKLMDWNLRILDIVKEMRESAGSKALEAEIAELEELAETLDGMID